LRSRTPLSPAQAQESRFGEPAVNSKASGSSQAGMDLGPAGKKGTMGLRRIGSGFNSLKT